MKTATKSEKLMMSGTSVNGALPALIARIDGDIRQEAVAQVDSATLNLQGRLTTVRRVTVTIA